MRTVFFTLAGVGLLLYPGAAFAATATNTLGISATVVASCYVTNVGTLSFGSLSVGQLPSNTTSTFIVKCTGNTSHTIGLDAGTTSGATTNSRKMAGSSTNTLSYALYQDAARQTNWGDSVGTWISATGTGADVTHTIYGQVPTQTWPAPGNYSDTVTITVTY